MDNKSKTKSTPLTEKDKLMASLMPTIAANLQGIETKEELAQTAYEYAKLFVDTVVKNNRN